MLMNSKRLNTIVINGETSEVTDVNDWGGGVASIEVDYDGEYIVAGSAEEAGRAARERWADMAENDPAEFRAMVGDETLIAWGMGRSAGPGNAKVNSLTAWLDLWLTTPEEEFASYDRTEASVDAVAPNIIDELGFEPTVAYRVN